jgi:hypothetical protein
MPERGNGSYDSTLCMRSRHLDERSAKCTLDLCWLRPWACAERHVRRSRANRNTGSDPEGSLDEPVVGRRRARAELRPTRTRAHSSDHDVDPARRDARPALLLEHCAAHSTRDRVWPPSRLDVELQRLGRRARRRAREHLSVVPLARRADLPLRQRDAEPDTVTGFARRRSPLWSAYLDAGPEAPLQLPHRVHRRARSAGERSDDAQRDRHAELRERGLHGRDVHPVRIHGRGPARVAGDRHAVGKCMAAGDARI